MARTARNIISNIVRYAISVVVPILITPFLIRRLGNGHYGLWILINSIISYYGLLDLGITPAIIRYVSKYIAVNERENLNSFVNTVLLIFLLVAVLVIIVSGVLSIFAASLFNLSVEDINLFSKLMIILGLAFALVFPAGVFKGILQGIQRYDISNAIDVSCSLVQSGIIVYLLSRGGTIVALGYTTLFVRIANVFLNFLFALRKTPMLRINLKLSQKNKLRTIFGYSFFTFIWAVSYRIRYQTDSLVIGAFLSTSAITYYSIGARLLTYYVDAICVFGTVTKPMFSSLEARNESEKVVSLLINGTRYTSLLAIFAGTSLVLYGKPFIRLWLGKGYESSYYILLILAIPYIIATAQVMTSYAAYGIGKVRFLSLAYVGEALANLGLSILLIRPYRIYGVAMGTAIPMLIMNVFIQPIYICRAIGLSLWMYVKRGLLSQIFIGIIYFAAAQSMAFVFHPNSYARMLASVSIGFVFFIMLSFVLCLDGDERRFCIRNIADHARLIHERR